MSSIQQKVVRELSVQLVAEVAPDEDELFDEIWDECQKPTTKRSAKSDPLSFGIGDAMSIVTPGIIHAANTVIDIIWAEAKAALGEAAKDYFAYLLGRLREGEHAHKADNRSPSPSPAAVHPPPVIFSPEALDRIRKLAQATARKEGADAALAESISVRLVARLALPQ